MDRIIHRVFLFGKCVRCIPLHFSHLIFLSTCGFRVSCNYRIVFLISNYQNITCQSQITQSKIQIVNNCIITYKNISTILNNLHQKSNSTLFIWWKYYNKFSTWPSLEKRRVHVANGDLFRLKKHSTNSIFVFKIWTWSNSRFAFLKFARQNLSNVVFDLQNHKKFPHITKCCGIS